VHLHAKAHLGHVHPVECIPKESLVFLLSKGLDRNPHMYHLPFVVAFFPSSMYLCRAGMGHGVQACQLAINTPEYVASDLRSASPKRRSNSCSTCDTGAPIDINNVCRFYAAIFSDGEASARSEAVTEQIRTLLRDKLPATLTWCPASAQAAILGSLLMLPHLSEVLCCLLLFLKCDSLPRFYILPFWRNIFQHATYGTPFVLRSISLH
jgi:hypothetical protein